MVELEQAKKDSSPTLGTEVLRQPKWIPFVQTVTKLDRINVLGKGDLDELRILRLKEGLFKLLEKCCRLMADRRGKREALMSAWRPATWKTMAST